MNIEWLLGKEKYKRYVIETRTRMYMAPCFRSYPELKQTINKFHCTAVGVKDNLELVEEQSLVFLLNMSKIPNLKVLEPLNTLRKHTLYIKDYPFGNILYDSLHAIVLRIPNEFQVDYVNFLLGRYSKMYPELRDSIFQHDELAYKVITKAKDLKQEVLQSYSINSNAEFDQAPNLKEETFNNAEFNPTKHSIVNSISRSKLNWL